MNPNLIRREWVPIWEWKYQYIFIKMNHPMIPTGGYQVEEDLVVWFGLITFLWALGATGLRGSSKREANSDPIAAPLFWRSTYKFNTSIAKQA